MPDGRTGFKDSSVKNTIKTLKLRRLLFKT
jgi:hypothetical protein